MIGLLMLAAFAAGWVDAIAGGGGLISLPALLAAGLPIDLAIGTNKGQGAFGAASALWRYSRAGLIDRKRARITFPLGIIGSLAGAALVLRLNPSALKPLVLILLVAVAVAMALKPSRPSTQSLISASLATPAAAAIAIVLGAYDGFFGPGTGTFLLFAFAALFAEGLQRASADAKVVNFASNAAALALFALRDKVIWRIALPMAAAQFAGAWLGAHSAVRIGEKLIRGLVLIVVLVLAIKIGLELFSAQP